MRVNRALPEAGGERPRDRTRKHHKHPRGGEAEVAHGTALVSHPTDSAAALFCKHKTYLYNSPRLALALAITETIARQLKRGRRAPNVTAQLTIRTRYD